jgi:hypothetical protein
MNLDNRRWLVIPSKIVDVINFSQILDNSLDGLRYSIDVTKTLIKYEILEVLETYTQTIFNPEAMIYETKTIEAGIYGRPSIYSEEYIEYNHQDILTLLSTSDWSK